MLHDIKKSLQMINTNTSHFTLTVAIPAYNESENIERIVREFLSTAYPNLMEIFVADGGSTDGTQDIGLFWV